MGERNDGGCNFCSFTSENQVSPKSPLSFLLEVSLAGVHHPAVPAAEGAEHMVALVSFGEKTKSQWYLHKPH